MPQFSIAVIVDAARAIQERGELVTRQSIAAELEVRTENVDQAVTNARQAGRLRLIPGRGATTRYRVEE